MAKTSETIPIECGEHAKAGLGQEDERGGEAMGLRASFALLQQRYAR
jgi:hypothetical protein